MCITIGAYLSDLYVLRGDTGVYDLPLVRFPQIKIPFTIGSFVVDIAICAAKGVLNLRDDFGTHFVVTGPNGGTNPYENVGQFAVEFLL